MTTLVKNELDNTLHNPTRKTISQLAEHLHETLTASFETFDLIKSEQVAESSERLERCIRVKFNATKIKRRFSLSTEHLWRRLRKLVLLVELHKENTSNSLNNKTSQKYTKP